MNQELADDAPYVPHPFTSAGREPIARLPRETLRAIVREHSNSIYHALLPAVKGRPFILITETPEETTGTLPFNHLRITANHATRQVTITASEPLRARLCNYADLTPGSMSLSTRSTSWKHLLESYRHTYFERLSRHVLNDPRLSQDARAAENPGHPELENILFQETQKLIWQLTGDSALNEQKKLTVALNKILPKHILRQTMRLTGITGGTLHDFNTVWQNEDNINRMTPAAATLFLHAARGALPELRGAEAAQYTISEANDFAERVILTNSRNNAPPLGKRAWRYLNQLTPGHVRVLLEMPYADQFLTTLAHTGETPRLTTLHHLSEAWHRYAVTRFQDGGNPNLRIFTAYARTITRHTHNMRGIKRFHATVLTHIGDYLNTLEENTLDQNQLNAPITWWINRDQEWHDQFIQQQEAHWQRHHAQQSERAQQLEKAVFPTSVKPTTIKGVTFEVLTTSAALREEGQLMEHCVGSYSMPCYQGHTRIARITCNAGTHVGTLELRYDPARQRWAVGQCLGRRNSTLNKSTNAAAAAFARAYTKAHPTQHEPPN